MECVILKHFGLFGLVLSAVMTVAGHFGADPGLSPWAHTISDFAAADRGGLVEFAMALAAVSTVALLPELRRRLAAALLAVWSAGLLVAAIVPTDPVGQALSTAGYVHRYASAAAFASLLGAGAVLARGIRPIGWLTALGSVAGAAMVASTYVFDRVAVGLAERVLAVAGVGLLIRLALHLTLGEINLTFVWINRSYGHGERKLVTSRA